MAPENLITELVVLRQSELGFCVGETGQPVPLLPWPIFNYNLPGGWFLVTAPVLTADWGSSGRPVDGIVAS